MNATPNADEAAAFARNVIGEHYDLEDWASITRKRRDAPAPIFQPQLRI